MAQRALAAGKELAVGGAERRCCWAVVVGARHHRSGSATWKIAAHHRRAAMMINLLARPLSGVLVPLVLRRLASTRRCRPA